MANNNNNMGVNLITIAKGDITRKINAETYRKQRDKKGWIEIDPSKFVQSSDSFVPSEVANMNNTKKPETTEQLKEVPNALKAKTETKKHGFTADDIDPNKK